MDDRAVGEVFARLDAVERDLDRLEASVERDLERLRQYAEHMPAELAKAVHEMTAKLLAAIQQAPPSREPVDHWLSNVRVRDMVMVSVGGGIVFTFMRLFIH